MTEEKLRDGVFHRLCREFQQAFIANGAPNEMALFAQAEPLDGTRRVFFTPGCKTYVARLIEGYGGQPCKVPGSDSLTLMFGVPGVESVSFLSGGDGVTLDRIPVPENVSAVTDQSRQPGVDHHVK